MASWAETSLKFIVTFQATAVFQNLAKIGNTIEKVDKQGQSLAHNLSKGMGKNFDNTMKGLNAHVSAFGKNLEKIEKLTKGSQRVTEAYEKNIKALGYSINSAGKDILGMKTKMNELHGSIGTATSKTKEFETAFKGQLNTVQTSLKAVQTAYDKLNSTVDAERKAEAQWNREKQAFSRQQIDSLTAQYKAGKTLAANEQHMVETEQRYTRAVEARVKAVKSLGTAQKELTFKQSAAHTFLDDYTKKVGDAESANRRLHNSFQNVFHAANSSANTLIASLSTVVLYAQQAANVYQNWGLNVTKLQGISGMSPETASTFLGTGKFLGIDESVMITSYRYAMKNTQTAVENFQKTLQKDQLAQQKAQQRIQDVQFSNNQNALKRQMTLEMKQNQISTQQQNAYWTVVKQGYSNRIAQEKAGISAEQAAVLQHQNKAGKIYKISSSSPSSASVNASYLSQQLSLNNSQQRVAEAQRSSIEKSTLDQNMRNLNMTATAAKLAQQAATGQLSWQQAVKKAQMGAASDARKLESAQNLAAIAKQQQQYNYSPDVSALMSIGILKPNMTKATIPGAKEITNELIQILPTLAPPERMKIMQKFFGRGAGSMIRYFMTSQSERSQIAKELGDAGIIMRQKDMSSWKTFYGQLKIMQIRWMGIQIAFTRALVPVITKVIPLMKPFLAFFQKHAEGIVHILGLLALYAASVKGIGALLAGINIAKGFGGVLFGGSKIAEGAKALFGVKTVLSDIGSTGAVAVEKVGGKFSSLAGVVSSVAPMFTNPATGIIAAVGLTTAAVLILYHTWHPFRNAVDGVLRALHLMKPATEDISKSMQFSKLTPSSPGSDYVTKDTAGFAGAQAAWAKRTGVTVQSPSEYLIGIAEAQKNKKASDSYRDLMAKIEKEHPGISPVGGQSPDFLRVAETYPQFRRAEAKYNGTWKVTLMPVGNREFYKLMQNEAMKTGKILVSVKDTGGLAHFAKILDESNKLAAKDMAAQQHQKTMQNILNTATGWSPAAQLKSALVVTPGHYTNVGGRMAGTAASGHSYGKSTHVAPVLNKETIKRLGPYIAQMMNATTEATQFAIANSVQPQDRLTMMAMMQYLNQPGQAGIDAAKSLVRMLVDQSSPLGQNTVGTFDRLISGQSAKAVGHTAGGLEVFADVKKNQDAGDKIQKNWVATATTVAKQNQKLSTSFSDFITTLVKTTTSGLDRMAAHVPAYTVKLPDGTVVPVTSASAALPRQKQKPGNAKVTKPFAGGTYLESPTHALIGEKGPEFVFNREQMHGLRKMFGQVPTGKNSLKSAVKESFSELLLPGRRGGTGDMAWAAHDPNSTEARDKFMARMQATALNPDWRQQYYGAVAASSPQYANYAYPASLTSQMALSAISPTYAPTNKIGTITANAGGGGGGMTRKSWALSLLSSLGISASDSTVAAVQQWEAQEGGGWNWSKFNPLNTTWKEKDSSTGNSAGVQIYNSWHEGLAATVKTLKNGYYGSILSALQSGDQGAIYNAINSSPWGTKNMPQMAGGGYVESPTRALIGERGPEFVFNRDQMKGLKSMFGSVPRSMHVDIQGAAKELAGAFRDLVSSGGFGASAIAHDNMAYTAGRPYLHHVNSVPGGSHRDHIHMSWGDHYGGPEVLRAGKTPGTGYIDLGDGRRRYVAPSTGRSYTTPYVPTYYPPAPVAPVYNPFPSRTYPAAFRKTPQVILKNMLGHLSTQAPRAGVDYAHVTDPAAGLKSGLNIQPGQSLADVRAAQIHSVYGKELPWYVGAGKMASAYGNVGLLMAELGNVSLSGLKMATYDPLNTLITGKPMPRYASQGKELSNAGEVWFGKKNTGWRSVAKKATGFTGDSLLYMTGGGLSSAEGAAAGAVFPEDIYMNAATSAAGRAARRGAGGALRAAINSSAKTRLIDEAMRAGMGGIVPDAFNITARRGANVSPEFLGHMSEMGRTMAEEAAAGRHVNPNVVVKGTRHLGTGRLLDILTGAPDILMAHNMRPNNLDVYSGGWLGTDFARAARGRGVSAADLMAHTTRHEFGHSADYASDPALYAKLLRGGGRDYLESRADAYAGSIMPDVYGPGTAARRSGFSTAGGWSHRTASAFARGNVYMPGRNAFSRLPGMPETTSPFEESTWRHLGSADMSVPSYFHSDTLGRSPFSSAELRDKSTPGSWLPHAHTGEMGKDIGSGVARSLGEGGIYGPPKLTARQLAALRARALAARAVKTADAGASWLRSGSGRPLGGNSVYDRIRQAIGRTSSFARASREEWMGHIFGGGRMPEGFEPGSPLTAAPLSPDLFAMRQHGHIDYGDYLTGRMQAIHQITSLHENNPDLFGNVPFKPSDFETTMRLDSANIYTVGGPYASTARFHAAPSAYYDLDLASRGITPFPLPDIITGTWGTKNIASHGASAGNKTSGSSVFSIIDRMISGGDIITPMALMNESGRVIGQQGRHRAFAADVLGVKQMPMDVISSSGRWTLAMIKKLKEFGLDFDEAEMMHHPNTPKLPQMTPNQGLYGPGPESIDNFVRSTYRDQMRGQRAAIRGMASGYDSFGDSLSSSTAGSSQYWGSSFKSSLRSSGLHPQVRSALHRMARPESSSFSTTQSFNAAFEDAIKVLERNAGIVHDSSVRFAPAGSGSNDMQHQLQQILAQISTVMNPYSSSLTRSNSMTSASERLVDMRYQLENAIRGGSNRVPGSLSPTMSQLDQIEAQYGLSSYRSGLKSKLSGGYSAFSRGTESWKRRVLGRDPFYPDSFPHAVGSLLHQIGPTVPEKPLSRAMFDIRNRPEMYEDYLQGWRAMGKTVGKWHSAGVPKDLQYIPSDVGTILTQDSDHNAFTYPDRTLLPDSVRRFNLPPEQYFAFDYMQRHSKFPVPDIMAASWFKGEHIGVTKGSNQSIQNIYERLIAGKDLVPPHIGVNSSGLVLDQNGRHRAFTAAMLGIKKIPVDIRMWDSQWGDDGWNVAEKLGINLDEGQPISARGALKSRDLYDVRKNYMKISQYRNRWGADPSSSALRENAALGGSVAYDSPPTRGGSAFARAPRARGGKQAAKDAAALLRYGHNFDVFLRGASKEDIDGGLLWYLIQSGDINAASLSAGVNPELGIHATAALSARQQWPVNKRDALALIDAVGHKKPIPKMAGLPENSRKAILAIHGTPLSELYKSLKVPHFDANLLGDPNQVTIDTWMARAASHNFGTGFPTDKQYLIMEQAIQKMAEREGIEPRQMQAIIWNSVQSHSGKSMFKPSFFDLTEMKGNATAFARAGKMGPGAPAGVPTPIWEAWNEKQRLAEYEATRPTGPGAPAGVPKPMYDAWLKKRLGGSAFARAMGPGAPAGVPTPIWEAWNEKQRLAEYEATRPMGPGAPAGVPKPMYDAWLKKRLGGSAFSSGRLSINEVNLSDFEGFAQRSRHPEFLTPYTTHPTKDMEWARMTPEKFRAFKVNGLDAGYMLKLLESGGSDIVGVHNNSKVGGIGKLLLGDALRRGGTNLDAYEGFLTSLYKKNGFREYNRDPWNAEFAPPNWNYKKFGTPDVVYMQHMQSAVDRLRGRYTQGGQGAYATPFMQQLVSSIHPFATGGVTKKPTLALTSEHYKTEAVFTEDQLRELGKYINHSGGRHGEIHVHLHGVIADNETALAHISKKAADMVGTEIDLQLRNTSG